MATDLKRMQRFYGQPSDAAIGQDQSEFIELLKEGVLGTVSHSDIAPNEALERDAAKNAALFSLCVTLQEVSHNG